MNATDLPDQKNSAQDQDEESAAAPEPSDPDVAGQIRFLRNLVAFLMLACLALSVCFNIYLLKENLKIEQQTEDHQELSQRYNTLGRFCTVFVADLEFQAQSDQQLDRVMQKYRPQLARLGLLPQSRPPGGP